MDDLDDLLDEIEKSFEKPPLPKTKNNLKVKKPERGKSSLDADIDDILDEDIDDILRETQQGTCAKNDVVLKKAAVPEVFPKSGQFKCSQILLGNSNSPSGLCSGKASKSCNNLRCTSCDFKVLQFNDFAWKKTTDYLFLRNNMPDYHRLKGNLMKSTGSRAYACQCSWKSISSGHVAKSSDLRWVCGKHKSSGDH